MIDVNLAYSNIKEIVYKTPLDKAISISDAENEVYLKKECLQPVKSFKLRGAMNRMLSLSDDEKKKGVVTISSGNHGLSVSYCAKLLGINKAIIIVPGITPKAKTDAIKKYGGEVIFLGDNYDEAHTMGEEYVERSGMTYIDPYDKDPLVYAGQGTVGLEIMMEQPEIESILVPVGGGGLITGVAYGAKLIKPSVRIIGVQTEACPAMKASINDNFCYKQYPNDESICEALIGGIGELAYESKDECIDDVVLVSERSITEAVAFLALKEKVIVEPSGAVSVAAVLNDKRRFGNKVACVLSGGNIDEKLFTDIIKSHG
jgi:threonine dehydratase